MQASPIDADAIPSGAQTRMHLGVSSESGQATLHQLGWAVHRSILSDGQYLIWKSAEAILAIASEALLSLDASSSELQVRGLLIK